MAAPLELRPEFTPPREQMGLLAGFSNELGVALPLPMEIKDRNGHIRQGEFVRAPLDLLNVVIQARTEYQGIDVLAGNIKEKRRLIHTPLVSRYDEEGARAYLSAAYGTFGKKIPPDERIKFSDLSPSVYEGKEVFYIVISGHRRLRALKMLEETDIIIQVVENIDPFEALELQVSENTARLPKDYERAEANGNLYVVKKTRNPKLTLKEFAAGVGHPEAVVRRDLRYYHLPEEVKNYVVPRNRHDSGVGNSDVPDQPLMPFTVACQLGRLVDEGASLHDILFLARRFFEQNITSEVVASKKVTEYIKDSIRNKSTNMVDIFGVNLSEVAEHSQKISVARRFAKPVDDLNMFFSRVKQAQDMGLDDPEEDMLSFAAAATRLRSFAELAQSLLFPGMRRLINDEDEAARLREIFREMEELSMGVGQKIDTSGILHDIKTASVSQDSEVLPETNDDEFNGATVSGDLREGEAVSLFSDDSSVV